jgi:serine/threonine protein phosphatase PrpC
MLWFGRKKQTPSGAAPAPVRVATLSARGLVRRDNQDHFFVSDTARVYCVADGMGGGAEGGRASEIICTHLREAVRNGPLGRAAVERSLAAASCEIFEYAAVRGFKQMGSTVALMLLHGRESGEICHIGDSRVYRIRRGLAEQLTRDHTVGVEMAGLIDRRRPETARDRAHPLAHILTRSVGTQKTVHPDWKAIDVCPGDRYIVCSDGVHDVVSATRLAALAGAGPVTRALERIEAEIVKGGAPDNYTLLLIEVPA